MVATGVVKTLLVLVTKSSDLEALRLACLCFTNVASCAATRARIVEEGALSPLVDFLRESDSDAIAKQYVAMTIGNLAAEHENHEEIVKLRTIEPLVKLLDPEVVHSGVYCAFALANLSVNNEHRPLIVDEGAVPRLIALACCSEVSAQRQALACLRGICISPANRVLVFKDALLDPLVLMVRSDERDIQREIASAFCALLATPENKVEIADRALLTIISMSLSGDAAVEEFACSTFANLVELHELHDKLLRENGLASIMALAVAKDLNTRSEACRCLANLTANEEVQPALMKEGVLQPLVAALLLDHHVCPRYVALALANLSVTASYQVQIVSLGTISPLIKLAQALDRELKALRCRCNALVQCNRCSAINSVRSRSVVAARLELSLTQTCGLIYCWHSQTEMKDEGSIVNKRIYQTSREIHHRSVRLLMSADGEPALIVPLPSVIACSLTIKSGAALDRARTTRKPIHFEHSTATGYRTLKARVVSRFEDATRQSWNPTLDIYVKPSSGASQRDYEVVSATDDALITQLQVIWHRAKDRKAGHAGFEFMFFVYVPTAKKQRLMTLRRATQARIQQQLPLVAGEMRHQGLLAGAASTLYAATTQARLGPDTPVQVPDNATFRQLQFIDQQHASLQENIAAAVATHSKSYPTVRIMISNVEVPIRVNIDDLRRILGHPGYPLFAPFNAPHRDVPLAVPPVPDEADIEDIDHATRGEDNEENDQE